VGALLDPATSDEAHCSLDRYEAVVDEMKRGIEEATGLPTVTSRILGWVDVQSTDELMAVWLMRAVITENVLARREGNVLYLPASPSFAEGDKTRKVVQAVARVFRLWGISIAKDRRATEQLSRDSAPDRR
jgi:hypothetical protein